ncbi:OsmC family protein [Cellulomonas fimi]|uniref:OsmC family protein n=1 Tax=Cellulomonas fimi (strain ATCC 484 / DSM 20113 / JCM 1341 / CCUG 24087 / LMG 16345 / NBRC 15513 / NCIMB 8980 / NCTC 7547 / NRS-133) TaxID=590998 RepID=F4GYZ8_CELFA|nr:OsmC family protein [Cellulomonas fimi]AEE45988.1 OsmC family protein [Cellulomonas fimi ATCC 484]NNH06574.1 OsmC family peroxiredoxin [Cellulomonas fimi]VEH31206.1 OsmC-like protein [Cellulomonas fimi]
MGPLHTYSIGVTWTGAGAVGTASYTSYSRDHDVQIGSKPALPGSSDPAFRGDPARYSPEELFVASIAQCHMLWFLHLASAAGVVVVAYTDEASGTMRVEAAGHGQFTEVVLRPRVVVARGHHLPDGSPVTDAVLAGLHHATREHCFIARSVNFPVRHEPATVRFAAPRAAVASAAGGAHADTLAPPAG